MLLPMLGGALVDWLNAPLLFALCATVGLVGVRAAWKLRDSRGLPADPIAAFASSGYLKTIAADRVGGTQSGWGA